MQGKPTQRARAGMKATLSTSGHTAEAAPGRPRSQAADAYAQLREQILSLKMAPGSQFTEGQIAAAFDTSKTPVREALVRLEHDGLVSSQPRSGYQVAPITLKETRELSELRSVILVEVAGRLAETVGLTPQQQSELEALIEQTTDPTVHDGTPEAATRIAILHRDIDMLLVRALGNARLTATVERVFDGLHRVRVLSVRLGRRTSPASERHAAMVLEAIRNHDVESARQTMRERVEQGQQILITALIEGSSLMSASISEGPLVHQ